MRDGKRVKYRDLVAYAQRPTKEAHIVDDLARDLLDERQRNDIQAKQIEGLGEQLGKMREMLKRAVTCLKYARYELEPIHIGFEQFPCQECVDEQILAGESALALTPTQAELAATENAEVLEYIRTWPHLEIRYSDHSCPQDFVVLVNGEPVSYGMDPLSALKTAAAKVKEGSDAR